MILQASLIFLKGLGPKRAIKLIVKYPAILLTPIFSFWTFGPAKILSNSKWCCGYCSTSDSCIGVSFLFTFLNVHITISVSISQIIIFSEIFHLHFGGIFLMIVTTIPLLSFGFLCILILSCDGTVCLLFCTLNSHKKL